MILHRPVCPSSVADNHYVVLPYNVPGVGSFCWCRYRKFVDGDGFGRSIQLDENPISIRIQDYPKSLSCLQIHVSSTIDGRNPRCRCSLIQRCCFPILRNPRGCNTSSRTSMLILPCWSSAWSNLPETSNESSRNRRRHHYLLLLHT